MTPDEGIVDMIKKMHSIGVISLFVAFMSGCAGMENLTKSDEYSVVGCAAGGLGAGALAYIKYHDDQDRDKKVMLITAIGCMTGAVVAFKVGKRTQKYADAQSAADAEIKKNEETKTRLKRFNARVKLNIEDYKTQISNLRGLSFSEEEKREQLKAIKKNVGKQRTKAKQSLASVETEVAASRREYQKFKRQTPAADKNLWQQRLAGLETEKRILSGHVTTLNAMDASI